MRSLGHTGSFSRTSRAAVRVILVLAVATFAAGTPTSSALWGGAHIRGETFLPHNLTGYFVLRDGGLRLSWNPSEATPATHALEFACQVDNTQKNACRRSITVPVDPLPRKAYLNVSRDLAIDLYLKPSSYPSYRLYVRGIAEITSNGERVGAMGSNVYMPTCYTSCPPEEGRQDSFWDHAWRVTPEVRVLAMASELSLRLDLVESGQRISGNSLGQPGPPPPGQCGDLLVCPQSPDTVLMSLAGAYRSTFRIPIFADEEVFMRHPEYFPSLEPGSAPPVENIQGPSAASLFLAFLGLAWPARVRRFLALALPLVVAGCVTAPGANDSAQDGGSRDPQGPRIVIVPYDPALPGDSHRGSLVGFVRDPIGQGVPRAHVSLLETLNFTDTNSFGRFEIGGVLPGVHDLRIEHASFHVFVSQIRIVANNTTFLDLQLLPLDANPITAHAHDYWGAAKEYLILDGQVPDPCI